ncbi:MAG TPA: helix-turn-helix domain-containing protein [Verrucomicrobiae bacterium]|nr:helix-turn-helix domain-containing protein [Verrucomicrobiae bacterium]
MKSGEEAVADQPLLYSLSAAAVKLSIGARTLSKLIRDRAIRPKRVGARTLIPGRELERFMAARAEAESRKRAEREERRRMALQIRQTTRRLSRQEWDRTRQSLWAERSRLRAGVAAALLAGLSEERIAPETFDQSMRQLFAGGYESYAAEAMELREVLLPGAAFPPLLAALDTLIDFLQGADLRLPACPR